MCIFQPPSRLPLSITDWCASVCHMVCATRNAFNGVPAGGRCHRRCKSPVDTRSVGSGECASCSACAVIPLGSQIETRSLRRDAQLLSISPAFHDDRCRHKSHLILRHLSLAIATQVNDNYLDARSSGFDRTAWAALRDKALDKRYTDSNAVHRCADVWSHRSRLCIKRDQCDQQRQQVCSPFNLNLQFIYIISLPRSQNRPRDDYVWT